MRMKSDTFGDTNEYPVLESLIQMIDELSSYERAKISTFINKFNLLVKKIKTIDDVELQPYILGLVKKDYNEKIDVMSIKYNPEIISRLRNYVSGKTHLKGINL